jgi:hypothetical protein
VSCVYRHPDYSALTLDEDNRTLSDFLCTLKELNLSFYVLGDFNLRDQYIRPLLTTLKRMNLNQLINVPTRKDKLLDLIIVNDFLKIMSVNVFDASIADHMLIECQINIRRPQAKSRTIHFRAFNKVNMEMLLADLNDVIIPIPNDPNPQRYI